MLLPNFPPLHLELRSRVLLTSLWPLIQALSLPWNSEILGPLLLCHFLFNFLSLRLVLALPLKLNFRKGSGLSLECRAWGYSNYTGSDNWNNSHFTKKALINISTAEERKYSWSLKGLICPRAPLRVLPGWQKMYLHLDYRSLNMFKVLYLGFKEAKAQVYWGVFNTSQVTTETILWKPGGNHQIIDP